MTTARNKTYATSLVKAERSGEVVALVSAFGNVDKIGDRVMPGAFEADLKAWRESGLPIPMVFSHRWDSADAYIGIWDAAKSRETPEGLELSGRIWMDDPPSAKIFDQLEKRVIRDFSFSYDILSERTGKDGANELVELHLIEAGPCLVGMNDQTVLVGLKGLRFRTSPEPPAAPADPMKSLEERFPLAAQELAKAAQREKAKKARRKRFAELALSQTVVRGQEPLSTEEIQSENRREAAEAQSRLETAEAERQAEYDAMAAAERARRQDLLDRIDAYGGYSQ